MESAHGRGAGLTSFRNIPAHTPPLMWALLGFAVAYILWFLFPVYLAPSTTGQFSPYIPVWGSQGADLGTLLSYSRALFVSGNSPYTGTNLHPPLMAVFLGPVLGMSFQSAFQILTLLTVFCYAWMTFLFPLAGRAVIDLSPASMLVFITGFFSYGLRFELDRGQLNVLAFLFVLLAIHVFHNHPRWRLLAYGFFVLSVQLKLYPFLFVIMLIDDWDHWKGNLARILLLAGLNLALFFVLGIRVFIDFATAATLTSTNAGLWWGNHSIRSFLVWMEQFASTPSRIWLEAHITLMEVVLLSVVVGCISLIMLLSWRNKRRGVNHYLLLACTIGSLVIPAVSNDYKLALLAAPAAVLLAQETSEFAGEVASWAGALLILVFTLAYASTLFSYVNKPVWLANSFPALLLMLLSATVLCLLSSRSRRGDVR